MKSMYQKPVRILMQEMIPALGIKPGDIFTREMAVQWFAENYPKVKQGTVTAHLIRLSTNTRTRLHYSAKADGSDDIFYKIDSSSFRLYDPSRDPRPINEATPDQDDSTVEQDQGTGEFAYEHDLRDFLARNLHLIETGLALFTDEDITGIEYPAGGRFIDILATDKVGNYVVIELKVSKGYDRVVGQLLRYVNWIRKNQAEPGQNVRGIIIAKSISEDLKLACSEMPNVSLMEYELAVTLRNVETE